MRFFMPITKIDEQADGTLLVKGIASSEALDADGETITAKAMQDSLPEFFKFGSGALREMHQPMAAGTVDVAKVHDDGITYIETTVVDPVAIKKVQTGTYKGFSIGGKGLARDPDDKKKITKLRLTEISLVDRPANPEATIQLYKADGPAPEQAAAVKELAELFDGDVIKPTELLELAKKARADKEAAAAALPDGTLKITKADELRAALRSFPRAKDAAIAKAHIIARAEALALSDRIPPLWRTGIAKGMFAVSWLAGILDSIAALQCDARWEKDMEGDDSAVPAALADWVKQGGQILQSMVAEETSEQAATTIAAAEPAGDIAKVVAAAVPAVVEPAPAQPQALTDALAKFETVTAELAKRDEQLATQKAFIDDLTKRLKTLEDQPLPAKGVTRVVDRASDNGGAAPAPEVDPIRKADGSIDEVATDIKKVHAAGGRRVFVSSP